MAQKLVEILTSIKKTLDSHFAMIKTLDSRLTLLEEEIAELNPVEGEESKGQLG